MHALYALYALNVLVGLVRAPRFGRLFQGCASSDLMPPNI